MAAVLVAVAPICARAVTGEWVGKWRADLAFVREQMPKVHPDLYHATTSQQFTGAIDSLDAHVPDLEPHEITVELMRIVATVDDGHTRLSMPLVENTGFVRGHSETPPPSDPALGFRHYPLRVYVFSDGVFVTRTDRAHERYAGARVVGIGNMTIDEATAAVTPTIQRDNAMQIRRHLPERLVIPEVLHARGVIDDMEKATFILETGDGERHDVRFSPVVGEAVDWVDAAPVPAPLYLRDVDRHFWFEYLADSRTVYWQYNTVYDGDDETVAHFADRLLAFIEANPVDQLVVDLRHNFGGNNGLNRALVHMLIRCTKTRDPGTFFAIVGRGTFSAAMMFCVDLERHTNVIFVGEPTGSSPNQYGDSRKLTLPNTGITVRVSTLYWQNSDPRDERPWIEPTMSAPVSSRDFFAGRDPSLEAILAAVTPVANADPSGTWTGRVIDFNVAVHLSGDDDAWSGTLDIPMYDAANLPLDAIGVDRTGVRFVLRDEDGDLSFQAAFRGGLLVGDATYHGRAYPFALARAR